MGGFEALLLLVLGQTFKQMLLPDVFEYQSLEKILGVILPFFSVE